MHSLLAKAITDEFLIEQSKGSKPASPTIEATTISEYKLAISFKPSLPPKHWKSLPACLFKSKKKFSSETAINFGLNSRDNSNKRSIFLLQVKAITSNSSLLCLSNSMVLDPTEPVTPKIEIDFFFILPSQNY